MPDAMEVAAADTENQKQRAVYETLDEDFKAAAEAKHSEPVPELCKSAHYQQAYLDKLAADKAAADGDADRARELYESEAVSLAKAKDAPDDPEESDGG